jgi:hypothetical protein
MTGRSAVVNELNGIWNIYLEMISRGFTTLSFEDWENEMMIDNTSGGGDYIDRIAQNDRRHLAKNDNMRKRLRQKLEERRKNKIN